MPIAEAFDVDPEYPTDESHVRRAVLTDPAEDGFFMRRQAQSSVSRNTNRKEVRGWSVELNNADATDVARLEALLALTRGSASQLPFTPPGFASSIFVRFDPDEPPTVTHVTAVRYRMRVSLVEAI